MAISPLGDRRSRVRYDVVGTLWGLLELSETARILNVSRTGALIESPFPAALASTHTVKLIVDGESVDVDARVRHVRLVESASGKPSEASETPRYLIGLEFLSPPESVLRSIDHLEDS
jgi:hypothetical protein